MANEIHFAAAPRFPKLKMSKIQLKIIKVPSSIGLPNVNRMFSGNLAALSASIGNIILHKIFRTLKTANQFPFKK